MKRVFLLAALFVTVVCNAQTVLWDGEDESITSRNEFGGWWDRGNPSVVDNPEKDGINLSDKCLHFTMTGNDFGQKHVALPFRDWMTVDLQGGRRVSLMIRKSQNDNVMIELSDPTNGADNYWEKTAAWYGSEGKWQKVVLDFSTNVNLNDFPGVMGITAQTGDVTSEQEVWIDNIVVEPIAKVGEVALKDITDNSLSGEVKVTGSLMRGDCQNTNGDWFRVDYDDFALLKDKLAAEATSLDLRGVILKDPYYDQILEKCPNIVIYTDGETLNSIHEVSESTNVAAIYNLAGQRVSITTKGCVIQNGRKLYKSFGK